jgi:hypothetical protein
MCVWVAYCALVRYRAVAPHVNRSPAGNLRYQETEIISIFPKSFGAGNLLFARISRPRRWTVSTQLYMLQLFTRTDLTYERQSHVFVGRVVNLVAKFSLLNSDITYQI